MPTPHRISFRPLLMILAALALLFCAQTRAAESQPQPNILLLLADNWAWPHAGICGDTSVKTPTFDRLAREGVLFTHAFCQVPSCSPARAVLLTGQAHAAQPIVADADGSITLRPYQAAIDGDLQLYPTDFEDQTEDYSYTHGRNVLSERIERKVGGWTAANASLQWQFVVNRTGAYKVRLRYSCGEDAPGTIKIAIGNDTLRKPVKSTGGWDEWSNQPVGRVKLDSNQICTLRVQVDSMESNRFVNLDHIKLTPDNTP